MTAQALQHFLVHVDDVEPAPVRSQDGWKQMDIRFLINQDNAESQEACLWRTIFPPGAAHERHSHPRAAEMIFVVRGVGASGSEDTEYEAPAGTAIYVAPGAVHWFRNLDQEREVEVVGFYVPGGSLEDAGYEYVGEITERYRQVGSR